MPKARWYEFQSTFGVCHQLHVTDSGLEIQTYCLDGVWQWRIRDGFGKIDFGSAGSLADAKRACVEALKDYYNEMLESLKEVDDEG